MIKWIFIVFCLFLGHSTWSQAGLKFKNYTINDGLSQSSVLSIVQDDLNSLWIGTQDGLNRYDGKSFEVFSSDEVEGLESEYITTSIKGENSNLWFGTNNGLTLYDFNKETFQTFFIAGNATTQINGLSKDSKGNIWLTTVESGLYSFNTKTQTFRSYYHKVPSKRTTGLVVINKDELYISCEENYVYSLKGNDVDNIKINEQFKINKLIDDGAKNKLLIATSKGVLELDLKTKENKLKFPFFNEKKGAQSISDLYYQKSFGWIITTTNNGLFILNENKKIDYFTEDLFQKDALLFNQINLIYKDALGTVWIGSQRGLSTFNPYNKGILGVGPSGNPEKGIPTPSVWSFSEDKKNDFVYIGTDQSVTRKDNKTGLFRQLPVEGKRIIGSVLSLHVIDKSKLLVGTTDGFYKLHINETSHLYERIEKKGFNDVKHKRIYSIVHWKESLYWLGTKDGVLLYNQTTDVFKKFEHNSREVSNTISKGLCREVFKDLDGLIWFATSTGGLNLLIDKDGELEIRPYEFNFKIRENSTEYITSIYQEKPGEYWFGTMGAGLILWNERAKESIAFNKDQGLPNNVIYGIVSGKKNELWLSTNRGLCNINTVTGEINNFKEIDGLMSKEFNLGAYMRSSKGILYFGGIYGYNYFDPEKLSRNITNIDVAFSKFGLENDWLKPGQENSPLIKHISKTKEIYLSYKQRSFSLKFQPSDVSNPEQINYKYVLEGSDEGDMILGNQNELHFNSLSHGTYKLIVFARLQDGPWSQQPAELNLIIATPFWLTWLFWVVVALLLALVIWLYFKKRIDAGRRAQVMLEMKITERTKEINQQKKKIERQKEKLEEERNKVVKQQKELQREKDKTENLLKNVIPESMAEELKKKGKASARSYNMASVLFTDFVGFTKIADRVSASELVKKLDVYFTKFDRIIAKNNLEKIKTIGDAYMCAGGVPVRNKTNPIDACTAALQIQSYMQKRKNDAIANGGEYWTLRLGINTGEVTAGVIGSTRLAYDVWGRTVNQAQRMEMMGEPETVTITGTTYELIEPYFECRYMKKVLTKSGEEIDMYVVDRIKSELSLKGEGIEPNKRFQEIVNLHQYSSINYYKAERHIVKTLEKGLSKNLHYHSIAHTKDVVNSVERIALSEGVTDEGLFLLKSAASYHDAGFVEKYDHNETIGARMAQEILPNYGYTQKNIDKIKELIYVTEIPHKPKNQLEEIICDADLDYLGRDDFHEIADRLCRELIEHGKMEGTKQWDEVQVKFLKAHKYFTKTSIKTRRKKKQQNLREVIERLERNEY